MEGDETAIRKLVESLCEGLPNCRVESVEWLSYTGSFKDFEIG